MQKILSPHDERLTDYSLLKSKESPSDTFVADHEKTAVRLLLSDFEVQSVFCTEKYWQKHKDLITSKLQNEEKCFVADKSIFEETIGFHVHQGFMAVGKQKWVKEEDLTFPILILNAIVDSENIGSILRSAAAFGIQSVLFDTKSASPYLRRSVRVSMGAIFQLKVAKSANLPESIHRMKKRSAKVIALALPKENSDHIPKTKTIQEMGKQENLVLIIGNEANGIEESVIDASDMIGYIPMKNKIDSLNVSHALAVALSHLL
ncbi:putative rRNA methylase [Leptospira ellinghausenii]|uniref:Putative rRNA methylase n=1 Tax=Leptospira ellinghausenii TaxID=1917822 RepID=A0A2P2DAC2_9LEPT|nr:RNA methyltransferase [Leptospira ellinghausenii]GBF41508.1 putative rRNA methylase [Leptospira ellinghausenii]